MDINVLLWIVGAIAVGLFLQLMSIQVAVRGNTDTHAAAIALRGLGILSFACTGAYFGWYIINCWYAAGSAPGLEWKGTFWIVAVLVGFCIMAGLGFWWSLPPAIPRASKPARLAPQPAAAQSSSGERIVVE